MGLTRRETYGSICKALLLNMVTTGRVEQEQTGMAWADTRIIQGQAWVDDRRQYPEGKAETINQEHGQGIRTQEI